MGKERNGIIESLSWKSIVYAIITFFGFFVLIPEYAFDVRPLFVDNYGSDTVSFIEGAILGAITTILVLKAYSYFSKEKKPEGKTIRQKRKLIEPKFVEEITQRFERVGEIFLRVVERGGGFELFSGLVTVAPAEEEEFKKHIDWLAENYPKIANDMSRATRIVCVDPISKVRIMDFDPILQMMAKSSLTSIVSGTGLEVREFYEHWQNGRARLRAYLGLLKEERE